MNKFIFNAVLTISLLSGVSIASATPVSPSWTQLDPASTQFSYSPAPANAIWHFNGNITPQNPVNIRTVVENRFSLTPNSLSLVSQCDSATSGCSGASATQSYPNGSVTNTFSSVNAFNYLAIHFGRAQLLFHWINPINEFSFTDLTGRNGFVNDLSNYRAYVDNVSPIPVPAAAWLFASGLGMFGVARRRVKK